MIKSNLCLLGFTACLALINVTDAQIVAIDGSHDLSGSVRHRDVNPPLSVWSDSFDQILPVTTPGPSAHEFLLLDNLFDSRVSARSEWDSDSDSVVGRVSKVGHINYAGWIGNNLEPEYTSHAITEIKVDLDAAGTPFRLTIDWDMLPYETTGDGWGYTTFIVYAGDDGHFFYYDLIAGGSLDNVAPNFGPTGTHVIEGVSRRDNLQVTVEMYGPGDSAGIGGCNDMFCGHASIDQSSFVNYELLVGDAADMPDTDSDGISDDTDNCTLIANADQRDTNGDNIGNACDADTNNDCIVNFLDSFAYRDNFFTAGDLDTDNNGDNITNFLDLMILSDQFFGSPGPSAAGCNT